MPKLTLIQSFKDLLSQLENEKIAFHRIENESTVFVSIPQANQNWGCYIRWEPFPRVVQFIQVLPFRISVKQKEAVLALINRINFDIPILGFVLNESKGILTYRTQIFLDTSNAISAGMVGVIIALSTQIVEEFVPLLESIVTPQSKIKPESLFDLK